MLLKGRESNMRAIAGKVFRVALMEGIGVWVYPGRRTCRL